MASYKIGEVAELLGVSVDSVYSHGAFARELGGLPFELIADFERNLGIAPNILTDRLDNHVQAGVLTN